MRRRKKLTSEGEGCLRVDRRLVVSALDKSAEEAVAVGISYR